MKQQIDIPERIMENVFEPQYMILQHGEIKIFETSNN